MIEIPDTGDRPLRTAHYFYTPERAVADAMAGELRATGFDVLVERAALGDLTPANLRWAVQTRPRELAKSPECTIPSTARPIKQ